MTAAAQTVSPATQRAEKALRTRAEQFYQLELKENFRQAEALVAEDSKDYFYNSGKPKMKDARVGNIEFTDKNTRAIVHIEVKVELLAPGIGAQVFSAPSTSTWKLEKGQWVWYFNKEAAMVTPFGKMKFGDPGPGGGMMDLAGKPSAAALESLVSLDRQSVVLTAGNPEQAVTISNNLPGTVTLTLRDTQMGGVTAQIEKRELKADEKTTVRFTRTGNAKSSGTVIVTVAPLNIELSVDVRSE